MAQESPVTVITDVPLKGSFLSRIAPAIDGEHDEHDYDALPETAHIASHAMAGALAGMGEHGCMYPIDLVKTRLQSLGPVQYNGVFHALSSIVRLEGLRKAWRGITPLLIGAGPAHALYFTFYESGKKTLRENEIFTGLFRTLHLQDHRSSLSIAVKQRMQMCHSPYGNVVHCCQCVYRQEGFRAFYRSFTTQLTMNIPFHATQFLTYEHCQDLMNPRREYHPLGHALSGAVAGATAAFVTTPLDVCKTLLNTQDRFVVNHRNGHRPIVGFWTAVSTVHRTRGFWGFWRGVRARVIFQMPGTAVSWFIYEFFKNFILGVKAHNLELAALDEKFLSGSVEATQNRHQRKPLALTDIACGLPRPSEATETQLDTNVPTSPSVS